MKEITLNLTQTMLDKADKHNTSQCNGALLLKKAINKGFLAQHNPTPDQVSWVYNTGGLYSKPDEQHLGDKIASVESLDSNGKNIEMMNLTLPMAITLKEY